MIELDRKRPFGTVHGEEEAHFEQDGILFDAHGKCLEHRLTDAQKADVAKRLKREEATRRTREALRKQLVEDEGMDAAEAEAAIDEAVSTPESRDPDGDGKFQGNGVNLIAWARGQEKHPWPSVAKAFKDQHNFIATGKDAALTFMRDEGLI